MTLTADTPLGIMTEGQLKTRKEHLITKAQLKEFKAILKKAAKYPDSEHEVWDTDTEEEKEIGEYLTDKIDKLSRKSRFYVFNIDDIVEVIREYQDKCTAASTLDVVITYLLNAELKNRFTGIDGSYRPEVRAVPSALAKLELPEGTASKAKLDEIRKELSEANYEIDPKYVLTSPFIIKGHSNSSKAFGLVCVGFAVGGLVAAIAMPLMHLEMVKFSGKPLVSFGRVLPSSLVLGIVAAVCFSVAVGTGIKSHLEQVKVDEAVEKQKLKLLY